ncbi:phosphonoacetaldehyde hydrolase [Novosphingobium percolationis]|uniref:phosphonoacetaldehyde hydrolase n=1 Tax=Novosphingobium percolationis TaxID=2871811 RepID=UPI001CD53604|nr:phosphonoacetaldehyde hydrolase [Novosphingobium percolationis]
MIPGLKAVVFDWAGTMIDFGSRAPVVALCKLFEAHGVPLEEAEARADMGLAKRDHIAAILRGPRVAAGWTARHGGAADEATIDRLFGAIGPMMREAANECATLIPGAADVAHALRAGGVKIGSCTGYTRAMMADILPAAAAQGYSPDVLVCAGDTAQGRPSPLMLWENLIQLEAWPVSACVKVDDAAVGIAEGRNAGVWTVGVAASGNGVGLSAQALSALPEGERQARIAAARKALEEAGAHLVIDTVADLPEALARLPIS